MAERFVRVDGLNTRYLEEGDGPAVVMFHGASIGSSAEVYADNLGPLAAAGLRAIAIDRPGYGQSDDPPDDSLTYEAAFVERFLDALGLPSACLVGHSQSATLAVMIALAKPERVPGVVVLAALVPALPGGGPLNIADLHEPPTVDNLRELLAEHVHDRAKLTPELLQRRLAMSTGVNWTRYQRRLQKRGGPPRDSGQLWERMCQQPERYLLLMGRDDEHYLDNGKLTSAARTELAQRQCPRMRIVLLEGCGHLVQWDCPDEFVRHTAEFVKAVPRPAGAGV